MKIPRHCRIEMAAADSEPGDTGCRKSISEPMCFDRGGDRKPVVVATDSKVMAVVEVECLDTDTVQGQIPGRALAAGRRLRAAADIKGTTTSAPVELALRKDAVVTENGDAYVRSPDHTYPKWEAAMPGPDEPGVSVAVDTRLLRRLSQALGDDVLRLKICGSNKPIQATTSVAGRTGVVMPVADKNRGPDRFICGGDVDAVASALSLAAMELEKCGGSESAIAEIRGVRDRVLGVL